MVKRQSKAKRRGKQGASSPRESDVARAGRITAETPYGECSERLTAFGGLLTLVKFLDLIGFEQAFAAHYVHPKRDPKLGGYRRVLGILMRLFIGFQRLGHFAYVRYDAMVCGLLRVAALPAVSTFWRYLRSLSIVQSAALLRLGAVLRATVWVLCEYRPARVTVNIDTTVSTVYGAIEGARKGHNPKHRGKKGLRPVLCFVAETREYLCGTQRRGGTMNNREGARQIRQFRRLLPEGGQRVRGPGDGGVIGWEGGGSRGGGADSAVPPAVARVRPARSGPWRRGVHRLGERESLSGGGVSVHVRQQALCSPLLGGGLVSARGARVQRVHLSAIGLGGPVSVRGDAHPQGASGRSAVEAVGELRLPRLCHRRDGS